VTDRTTSSNSVL